MKRVTLILILIVVSVAAVPALDMYVTPSLNLNLGINNYFRGGSAEGQFFMDFKFLAVGLEVKADYDAAFGNFNIPVLLLVSYGRDFWLGAGYTIGVTPMTITDSSSSLAWGYGGFPNTYALGFNILRFPLGFGILVLTTEITYTVNSPVYATDAGVAAFAGLVGFFLGLQASIGVGLEMKL
jgi:hypothetical protein